MYCKFSHTSGIGLYRIRNFIGETMVIILIFTAVLLILLTIACEQTGYSEIGWCIFGLVAICILYLMTLV